MEILLKEPSMRRNDHLPIAIIGAGPVGLAAAANLAELGISFHVYEAGATVGANVRDWGHVRIFTSWEQSADPASRRLLEAQGWKLPSPDALPTGEEIYRGYLKPLSELSEIGVHLETRARVVAIARKGIDKVASKNRYERPFELRIVDAAGTERVEYAHAVIDASGTWHNPNPLGGSGLPARGESSLAAGLAYGMPDVLGTRRSRYAGKRVAVVGAGYSAINVLLDLVRLGDEEGRQDLLWVVRGRNMARIYGGGDADELVARGKLGQHLSSLVERRAIRLVTGFSTESIEEAEDGLVLIGDTGQGPLMLPSVDEIIVSTGQRPDLTMTRELRLELDPWLEAVKALGPLIDPNVHSCGSVPPHGHRETSHPEPGFYTIGVKSYGRAPTFLLLTGYEQARSVAAALAGDMEAADNVHLVLPDTGICTTDFAEDPAACCGGPAPVEADACCVADAVAKESGNEGCGCRVAA
jgi:pyruvate/2-oxoglutarate dehydrogenase complex dihydrolipoamide dehydrogenase (E3) component